VALAVLLALVLAALDAAAASVDADAAVVLPAVALVTLEDALTGFPVAFCAFAALEQQRSGKYRHALIAVVGIGVRAGQLGGTDTRILSHRFLLGCRSRASGTAPRA
jgi:hypothetical protein